MKRFHLTFLLFFGFYYLLAQTQKTLTPAEYWNKLIKNYNELNFGVLDLNISIIQDKGEQNVRVKMGKVSQIIDKADRTFDSLLVSNPDDAQYTKMMRQVFVEFKGDLGSKAWQSRFFSKQDRTFRQQYEALMLQENRSKKLDTLDIKVKRVSNLYFKKYKDTGIEKSKVADPRDSLLMKTAAVQDYIRGIDLIRLENLVYFDDFIQHTNHTSCDSMRADIAALEQLLPLARNRLKTIGYFGGDASLYKQTERCIGITEAFMQKDGKRMFNLCKKWRDNSISQPESIHYNKIVTEKMDKVIKNWQELVEMGNNFTKKYTPASVSGK